MTTLQMGFLGLLFVAVFAGAMFVLLLAVPDPLRQRLDSVGAAAPGGARHWLVHFVKLSGPLARLSLPEDGWETSKIRLRFMHAGLRHPSAPLLYFGAKTALAVGLPVLLFLGLSVAGVHYSGTALLLWLLLAAAFGYYLPNAWLNRRIRLRQRDIFESFPDALDLMTVCVEAGLAMDAALARVASEITLKSAVLAEELHLLTLELRAGNSKERALRNLALRTGVEDVDALVAMLIQAERFGTSIAASLRVQSDQLRTKRRQLAEEQAAKIALKLLFPLIFFIFPSLLVVLMGPAFLQIYRVLLPGMAGGN
ncbi:type II secretion system F family protein [Janthinobacterium lividum]|uniref:type II secretion system F family protein n=1 Tax=Janthinobacterium lividum TaxID=29581 RepID=UPI00087386C5|nr:type II secretion system F family protein [Janthinobacterium lividum]MCC7714169.1 type II secretion system F family protein [Janthinobacterium lividum]OEZ47048.1 bacterial type II secretion system protein F domain protein [Janthinobacterium lividum]WQE27901.1 type II secretion system F family protein [Janthinobacterium lividum]STQ98824.1 Flp pilus assembly protein TadB [Janthinobacterium lividum]